MMGAGAEPEVPAEIEIAAWRSRKMTAISMRNVGVPWQPP